MQNWNDTKKNMKIEHAKGNSHADVMTGTGVHDYK